MKFKLTFIFFLLIDAISFSQISVIQSGPTHESIQFFDNTVGFSIAYSLPDGSEPNGLLRKTIDGGSTWNHIFVNFSPTYADYPQANKIVLRDKLQFLDQNTGYCSGNLNDPVTGNVYDLITILKTSNGGTSWTAINQFSTTVNDIRFINENDGFVTTGDKIFKTGNGGSSFQQVYQNPSTGQPCDRIYFVNSNLGFVSSSNRIHRTNDGGIT